LSRRLRFNRAKLLRIARRLALVVGGALVVALGYTLFLVPFNIAAGGLSGIAIIVNHFTGWPIGLMYLVMNVPLLVLGFQQLGGWRFLSRTLMAVLVFSAAVEFFVARLPGWLARYPLTDDVLLNALYGGIIGGIGAGLIYRSGGTMGGTSILGRVLQQRTGEPLSQVHFYTDGVIVLTAGVVFGWETALYALLTLFVNGLAADYTLEGPSSVRSVTIITDRPDEVSQALIEGLGRGVSQWEITGGYTGERHSMILCTVYRPQVNELKQLVADADHEAFVVIGTAHQALGFGFTPLKKRGRRGEEETR
jgi:uncharacterized membrane-anchored protein YitT (DUF2179 family)